MKTDLLKTEFPQVFGSQDELTIHRPKSKLSMNMFKGQSFHFALNEVFCFGELHVSSLEPFPSIQCHFTLFNGLFRLPALPWFGLQTHLHYNQFLPVAKHLMITMITDTHTPRVHKVWIFQAENCFSRRQLYNQVWTSHFQYFYQIHCKWSDHSFMGFVLWDILFI